MVPHYDELDRLRTERLGVVTTAELNRLGFTASALRANLDAGRWQRIHPGVYVLHTGAISWATRAWAGLAYAGAGAVLSHHSAAHIKGWTKDAPTIVDVTVPYSRRARAQPSLRVHRSRAYAHIVQAEGLPPRTTGARTVADILREQACEQDAITYILESIRRRHVDPASLRPVIETDKGHPWRKLAPQTIEHAGAGLLSHLELKWAALEQLHGLPPGRRQYFVRVGSTYELQDVNYDDYGVIVELDGRINHETIGHQFKDRRRDNRNAMAGRVTLRYGYVDLERDGCGCIAEVASVLVRAGWRGTFRRCEECEPK